MTSPRVDPSPANTSTYGVSRDYSALATWEAATDLDLVTLNAGEILKCFDDAASFDDFVSLDGATSDATRYRVVRPETGEGHDGTPNNGVSFFWTSEPAIDSMGVDEPFGQYQDLILKRTPNGTAERQNINLRTSGTDGKAIGCIVIDTVNSGSGLCLGFKVKFDGQIFVLCIAIDGDTHGFGFSNNSTDATYAYNCVAVGNAGRGFNASTGTSLKRLKNCLAHGNTNDDFDNSSASWDSPSINNASDDSTADEGGLDSATAVVDATFNFVNAAGDDYHLDTGDTDALDAGADLSADSFFAFDEDIDGDVFNVWDIGFDEPQPAVAGRPPLVQLPRRAPFRASVY